jgi:ATP-dependent Lon protease
VHSWPEIGKIEALQADYPNFSEVCEFVIRKIGLSRHTPSQAVSLPNILLEGGPSTGKSSFTERLTSILVGEDYARIDLGQAATNFALVGSDSGFKGGKEGRILRLMAADATRRPVANPVVIFDEVDKALDESRFSPLKALLSLLEKRDAKRFTDEFFTVPVDASRINFFGLANTLQPLSQPLLSRFTIFQIDDYTDEQFLGVVIPAIYREWSGRFFPGTFPQSLSLGARQDIADAAGSVPRRVAAVLDQLVSLDHPELTPSPVWEGLAGYPVSPRGEAVGEARE